MQNETSVLPSLAFATNPFVGNLGAPVRVSNKDDEDDELQDLGDSECELQEQNREGTFCADSGRCLVTRADFERSC